MEAGTLTRAFVFCVVAVAVTMHADAALDQGVESSLESAEADGDLGIKALPAGPTAASATAEPPQQVEALCGEHKACRKAMVELEARVAAAEGKHAESEARAAKLQREKDELQLALTLAQTTNNKLKRLPPGRPLGEVASEGVAYGHVASSNVALNKPTEQSSMESSSSRAVDGNTNTGWGGRSVTHTSTEDNPWWRVDLQTQRTVAAVRVVNRGDCCGTRLDLFTVKVGDQVCGSNLVVPQGETGDVICEGGPLVASSVTIELPGKHRILSLAEVEVYEAGAIVASTENAAAGKPTSQKSDGHGGASSRAVDGNADTSWGGNSCTHTSTETDPWWRTDLEQELAIANVKITNRGDCCGDRLSNFEVKVGNTDSWNANTKCGDQHSVAQGATLDVSCSGEVGRYVFVGIPGSSKILTLCEVEVNAAEQPCYDGGIAYATQACASCTGPGPTQCTACSDSDALVPWRKNGAVAEGACQEYDDQVQVREIPGTGSLAAMTLASVLGKWGKQEGTVSLPAVSTSGLESVQMSVTCYVRKAVWCEARNSIEEDLKCDVEKDARLASVARITYPVSQVMAAICTSSGGQINGHAPRTPECNDVPANDVLLFANVTSIHDACAAVIKLL